jgi:hypothetical protein
MTSSRFRRLGLQLVLGTCVLSATIGSSNIVGALEQDRSSKYTAGAAHDTIAPQVSSTASSSNRDVSHVTATQEIKDFPTTEGASTSQNRSPEQADVDFLRGHIEPNVVAGHKRYQRLRATGADVHDRRSEDADVLHHLMEENMAAGQMLYQAARATSTTPPSSPTIQDADLLHLENLVTQNMLTVQDQYRLVQDRVASGRRLPPPRPKDSPILRLPKPIMVVGFPKAGTSSIFSFFHCSGLRSMHWYCCDEQTSPQAGGPQHMSSCMLRNLANNYPILYKCGNFDVFAEMNGPRKAMINETGHTGILLDNGTYDFEGPGSRIMLPQHHYLQDIHDEYPSATFILNLRPVEEWMASVLRWGNDLANQLVNEYYVQSGGVTKRPTNTAEMVEFLSEIYTNHNTLVREFVQEHPSHALVEVDISDAGAGDLLADSFGLNATCWKQVNRNPATTIV